MPTLTPPTFEEGMGPTRGLFRYYKLTRGVALLVFGDEVVEERYPFQGDIAEADAHYLGGHTYEITDDEAAILTNAGYGDYIS